MEWLKISFRWVYLLLMAISYPKIPDKRLLETTSANIQMHSTQVRLLVKSGPFKREGAFLFFTTQLLSQMQEYLIEVMCGHFLIAVDYADYTYIGEKNLWPSE